MSKKTTESIIAKHRQTLAHNICLARDKGYRYADLVHEYTEITQLEHGFIRKKLCS